MTQNKNLKKTKLVETYYSEKSRRDRRLQKSKFFPAIVTILREIIMRSYWLLRGYEKGKEGYYLKDNIRYIYQRWSHGRQATGKYALKLKLKLTENELKNRTIFKFKNGDVAAVECYDWDESMQTNEIPNPDSMSVSVNKKDVYNWIN